MIAPAETVSPPNAFTPSRFEVESRPLRDEPPPFLCAMVRRGYQLVLGSRRIRRRRRIRRCGRVSGLLVGLLLRRPTGAELHVGDLQHRQELTMAGLPGVAGLGPVLEDLDLVALLLAERLGDDDRLRGL